jgi:hypothetical protein
MWPCLKSAWLSGDSLHDAARTPAMIDVLPIGLPTLFAFEVQLLINIRDHASYLRHHPPIT